MLNYQRVSIQFLGSQNPYVDIMINVSLPTCQSKIRISLSNSWPESNYLISHSDPYTNIVCRDMPSFAFKVDGSINCRSCNGIWTSIPYWNDVPLQGPQHSFNNTMAHCHSPAALQALMAELNVTWTAPKGSKGASAPWGNPPWKVNMSFQKPST